jgi:hypothetical protein
MIISDPCYPNPLLASVNGSSQSPDATAALAIFVS